MTGKPPAVSVGEAWANNCKFEFFAIRAMELYEFSLSRRGRSQLVDSFFHTTQPKGP